MKGRIVVWFSCGAASACAAKFSIEKYGKDSVSVVYCNTFSEEHQDNFRFMMDVEKWLETTVNVISSGKYKSPTEVFERTRYMSGPQGARCTVELKKIPRFEFQKTEDTHVFGFTADSNERKRIRRFEVNNPELKLDWILLDAGVTKAKCYKILTDARIKLPEMYIMGYKNNNCMGCVKASSPGYWNKIRTDFPEIFNSRAEQSRRLGCKLVILKGQRIFLDELPLGVGKFKNENISCGPECGG